MAKIKKEDLEHLTNQQLHDFYTVDNWRELPSPIVTYVKGGEVGNTIGQRLNRVQTLISQIIVKRFIAKTLSINIVKELKDEIIITEKYDDTDFERLKEQISYSNICGTCGHELCDAQRFNQICFKCGNKLHKV